MSYNTFNYEGGTYGSSYFDNDGTNAVVQTPQEKFLQKVRDTVDYYWRDKSRPDPPALPMGLKLSEKQFENYNPVGLGLGFIIYFKNVQIKDGNTMHVIDTLQKINGLEELDIDLICTKYDIIRYALLWKNLDVE